MHYIHILHHERTPRCGSRSRNAPLLSLPMQCMFNLTCPRLAVNGDSLVHGALKAYHLRIPAMFRRSAFTYGLTSYFRRFSITGLRCSKDPDLDVAW